MRFVALVLAAVVLGAGVGIVSVGTAQAHGGDGGGAIEVLESYATCPVANTVQASVFAIGCTNTLDGGAR
jgi:hypothetical protein